MKSVTALLVATTITLAAATTTLPLNNNNHKFHISNLINVINTNPTSTWTAEFTPQSLDLEYAKAQFNTQIGSLSTRYKVPSSTTPGDVEILRDMPLHYDVREAFPQCSQPRNVMDQGPFGICWATATMGAAADRYCIAKKDSTRLFSVVDLVTCCPRCGSTGGGDPEKAYYYLAQTGVVSGHSDNQNTTQCVRFPFPQCDHLAPRWEEAINDTIGGTNLVETTPGSGMFVRAHNHHQRRENHCNNDELKPCRDYIDEWVFPKSCTKRCDSGSPRTYSSDLVRSKDAYSVYGEAQIMNDILQFGSVVGVFDVYEDFLLYKTGIYSHDEPAQRLGLHAVVIVGWGEEERVVVNRRQQHDDNDLDNEPSSTPTPTPTPTPSQPQPQPTTETIKYWIIRNSWNDQAEENGYFRIYRGDNATKACYIQAEAYATKF